MTSSDSPSRPSFKGQPIFNAPPYVLWTCVGILLCSLAYLNSGWELQDEILIRFAVIPYFFLAQFGNDSVQPSLSGLLPLVTYTLLHASMLHLIVNLGFLLAFGTAVERSCGGLRMLLIFVVSAVAGAVLQVWSMGPVRIPVIGASGAVFGLMGATLALLIQKRLDPRMRRLASAIVVMMILNLVFALSGLVDWLSGLQIAWEAHVGGFLAGLLLGFVSSRRGLSNRNPGPPT